jgi:hypothetical protein
MSAWRNKAIECLPELRKEFEQPETSIYDVFIELLPATVKAHSQSDKAKLKKLYDFAEWCFRQEAKELWNAAGVSFYEHLIDYAETKETFAKWVKPDIYNLIRPLIQSRLSEVDLKKIDKMYSMK